MRKRLNLEHIEQCALIKWARMSEARYPELKFLFAIPNGGKRDIITAYRMSLEGARAGIPDLMLAVPRGQYHGMFLEMKAGRNKPTEKQNFYLDGFEGMGYHCGVYYDWQVAQEKILWYLAGQKN